MRVTHLIVVVALALSSQVMAQTSDDRVRIDIDSSMLAPTRPKAQEPPRADTIVAETAPTPSRLYVHGRGGLTVFGKTETLGTLPELVDCGVYTSGSGASPVFSVGAELLRGERLSYGLGLVYRTLSSEFKQAHSFDVRASTGGPVQTVNLESLALLRGATLEIQPEVRLAIIPDLFRGPLRAFTGFRFVVPLQMRVEQTERVVSPESAAFVSDRGAVQSRTLANASLSNVNSLAFGASLGLENVVGVSEKLGITQQLCFDYNTSDIVRRSLVRFTGFRFDVGIRYGVWQ